LSLIWHGFDTAAVTPPAPGTDPAGPPDTRRQNGGGRPHPRRGLGLRRHGGLSPLTRRAEAADLSDRR